MTNTPAPKNTRVISMSWEAGFDEIAKLSGLVKQEINPNMIYSGHHPEYGNVFIVQPAWGNTILFLPFAIQQSD